MSQAAGVLELVIVGSDGKTRLPQRDVGRRGNVVRIRDAIRSGKRFRDGVWERQRIRQRVWRRNRERVWERQRIQHFQPQHEGKKRKSEGARNRRMAARRGTRI